MRVSELGLPGTAEQKLAQLAMAIEIHCRQRFSTCKSVMEIAAMLIVADTCGIELVRRRKSEFIDSVPPKVLPVLESMTGSDDCAELLSGRGISYRGRQSVLIEKAAPAPGSELNYRGSRQPLDDEIPSAPAGKAVRRYRGQIISD